MRRLCFIFMVIAVLAAMTISVSAQSTATLTGTVKDATGAVVVGANVTIENQATGEQRKFVTNKDGFFSATALPVAVYKVAVSAKGFARYQAKDVGLNANDSKALSIELPLASVTETVEVSGTMSSIALTDSGEKSSVLTTKDLNVTPLASRNAAEIIKIMGGATMEANGGKNTPNTTPTIGINGYTVGGNASGLGGTKVNGQSVDITLDGGHTFDPGAAGSATPVNPNMDMIQEVKVMASNFSAEYEKGPVVFNAETKGGGKDFHGQARFAAQHHALNSTDANNKSLKQPKSLGTAYYPSAQLSGPIPVGGYNKNKDRLFFFEGFEAYRQKVDGAVALADVPTDGMLAGDFSQAEITKMAGSGGIWNLNTVPSYSGSGQPWSAARPGCTVTNGVLSAGCIDPSGLAYLKTTLPRPNADPTVTGGYNFALPILANQNSWQNVARVDWTISDNTRAYVRYSRQRELSQQPLGLWGGQGSAGRVPAPTPIDGNYKSDSLATTLTHVFSPTMTSESTFYYTFEGMPNTPEDFSKLSRSALGITWKTHFAPADDQIPAITSWGSSFPYLGSGNNLGNDFSPSTWRTKPGMMADKGMPALRENLTKVIGTHTLKFGAFWEHIYNKQDNWGQYMGTEMVAQGWGTGIGNPYADTLMGIINGQYDETQMAPATQVAQNMYEGYVNDHWKINRRLSVDLGMRFDHYGKPYSPVMELGLATWYEGKYSNDPAQLNAHTGVSWHQLDKSIPLSGSSSRFAFYSPRFGMAWDVFGNAKTVVRGGWGQYRTYDSLQSNAYTGPASTALGASGFHCDAWSCPTWESIGQNAVNHPLPAGLPPGLVGISVMDPKNDQQPLITTFSFSIDQQLPAKFMLETSYVGNRGSNFQQALDINAVPVGTVPYSYVVSCNAANNCNSYDNFRPRTNYKNITESMTLGGSQYDSLQLSLHRAIGWLNLRANYTWSKTYGVGDFNSSGNSGAFKDYGLSEYWGISPQHRPHSLNIAYTLTLPKIRSGNAFVGGLINGWSISGITSYNSGANQTAQNYGLNYGWDDGPSGSGIFHSNVASTGSPSVNMHPLIVCDPRMTPTKVIVNPTTGQEGMQYLNPNCFKPATMGTAGTTSMPYIPGPSFFNSDISVIKNVNITERHKLEFKVQAFNFLNRAQWSFDGSDPNMNVKFHADGTWNNPTFGVATRKFGHRLMELGVTYRF